MGNLQDARPYKVRGPIVQGVGVNLHFTPVAFGSHPFVGLFSHGQEDRDSLGPSNIYNMRYYFTQGIDQ